MALIYLAHYGYGSATLMRGKPATCRRRTFFNRGLRPVTVTDRQINGHVSANPRLAAHQSGRAIAAVASKFDRNRRGDK